MDVHVQSSDRAQRAGIRYHSLDALRGLMMLLGIYLHAALAYSEHGNWPWKDGSTTALFDVSAGLIHVFRMPVFYVLAGFFAAMLYERRGAHAFVRNRTVRIVVPFLVGWALLFPLVKVIAMLAVRTEAAEGALGSLDVRHILGRLDPMHLWFLEYLVFFYVIALAVAPLARSPRLAAPLDAIDRRFRTIIASRWAPCVLACGTGPVLLFMQEGAIDDPSGFAPEGRILLAYLVFFACGWLLWRNADLLPALQRFPRAPVFVAIGIVTALLGYLIWYWQSLSESGSILAAMASAWLLALAMWSFVLGLIGIFLRYFDQPDRRIRYLADSSYWLYLCHMPALLVFQIAAAETDWPPAIKAMAVFVASVTTLLASYHILVRPTWIGAILNGRTHPVRRRETLTWIGKHRDTRASRRATS